MKKVLTIVVIALLVVTNTVCGVLFFRSHKQAKELEMTINQLNAQSLSPNAQNSMLTAYTVSSNLKSGTELTEANVVPVTIDVAGVTTNTVTSIVDLEGKVLKLNTRPGTIITQDILADSTEEVEAVYTRDIQFASLPVSTQEGDYVDIKVMLPNGEPYCVLSHKKIKYINGTTLTFDLSHEEEAVWLSALNDYALNESYGFVLYLDKYLNPGKDQTLANYPVNRDMENYILFNTDYADPTRCINKNLRDHIDQILFMASTSDNSSVSSKISAVHAVQLSAQQNAYEQFIEAHTNDEGVYVAPDEASTEETEAGDDVVTSEDMIEDGVESLETSMDELGGIE